MERISPINPPLTKLTFEGRCQVIPYNTADNRAATLSFYPSFESSMYSEVVQGNHARYNGYALPK